MIGALSFAFANPAILAALLALPVIWWLLRMTPPRPAAEVFPPLRILASVIKREETPSKSPWWLTLLRMLMATAVILAIADPVFNPRSNTLSSAGPLALLIDNSWATAPDWERRVEAASALIDDAEAKDIAVSVVLTGDRQHNATPGSAAAARTRLAAAAPEPLPADRRSALSGLKAAFSDAPPGTIAFITDGIEAIDGKTMEALAEIGAANIRMIEADGGQAVALTGTSNESSGMSVTATRLKTDDRRSLSIVAYDTRGHEIAEGAIDFAPGEGVAKGTIEAPFELRNDFARIGIEGAATAGATHLLDDGFRRRRVALLSGEARDLSQPLLSPLYYINRALAPYADLVEPRETDLAVAIPELLEEHPSVLIMADIGRLPEETYPLMTKWIDNGGTLIRFAGPRLAAAPADDPLVPVTLRQGERALGGALSWSEPQPLADYPATGPFAGMARPTDILVKRQVLAEPTADLVERTWASLADGTPLVTTASQGAGRIILFHVSAEATWSNLPISGDFVEMLRRSVQLSRSGGVAGEGKATTAQALAPYRLLNADGVLVAETGNARPLDILPGKTPLATPDNPPGLYGSEDGFTALNLLPRDAELKRIDMTTAGPYTSERLAQAESWSLKPALLTLALLLLLADAAIVLFMGGAFSRIRMARSTAALVSLLAGAALLLPPQALADDTRPDDDRILERLDTTHLAYVVTG
ncbi:MAG TPA: BatA domain-containing protein, partial [Sinorhizobium sp.]|nr:BatA domain-containing protein [Sinorhizobium sp.]